MYHVKNFILMTTNYMWTCAFPSILTCCDIKLL